MAKYIYECPVTNCNNLITLTMDMESCPFQRQLIGQCEFCNLKIDILQDDYKEWAKGKEVKQDYPESEE